MTKIGIDEETHILICDYVEGNLDENKKKKIEKLAVKSKSVRDLITDTQFSRNILVMYASKMTS
jgi:hypothetical protein